MGLPEKTNAVIKREIGALARASVYTLLKKATKVELPAKAVTVGPVKKVRPTPSKEGSVLANVPAIRFTITWWKCYLDSCATYHSLFMEEFLHNV